MAPRKARADGAAAAPEAAPGEAGTIAAAEVQVQPAAADAATGAAPQASPVNQAERAQATAASRIEHDGTLYEPGSPINLTEAEFDRLRPTGALHERSWDDCMLTF